MRLGVKQPQMLLLQLYISNNVGAFISIVAAQRLKPLQKPSLPSGESSWFPVCESW
jgi:hypothetical protein